MAKYLFKFDKARKWDTVEHDWLGEGQVSADPLTDLLIEDGSWSVWSIEDDDSNLDLVLMAIATTRHYFSKIEYGLFDPDILAEHHFSVRNNPGETAVTAANQFHMDVVQLTTARAAELVDAIFFELEQDFRLKREVKDMVLSSWGTEVTPSLVKNELRQRVERS